MKKVKKIIALMICAVMTLTLVPSTGIAAGKNVTVTVANFDVFLNGVKMDSANSEYPLLLYRNITYVPMTWNLTRFMGLKTRFDRRGNESIFFIGNTFDRTDTLKEDRAGDRNRSSYTAYVTDYKLAVNDVRDDYFIDNSKEQYPILTFRDITYFPLTWRFAHDCFGWDYYYDIESGLAIDSRNAFRPEWNEDYIWSTGATAASMSGIFYVCNDNAYVGWRESDIEYNRGGELIWGRRNMGETVVDLTNQLKDLGITKLNRQFNLNTEASSQPRIDGNRFFIRTYAGDEGRTYDLEIDLSAGEITSIAEILFDSRGNVTGKVTPLEEPGNKGDIPSLDGGSDGTIDLGGESTGGGNGGGQDSDSDGTVNLDGDGVIDLDEDDESNDGTLVL